LYGTVMARVTSPVVAATLLVVLFVACSGDDPADAPAPLTGDASAPDASSAGGNGGSPQPGSMDAQSPTRMDAAAGNAGLNPEADASPDDRSDSSLDASPLTDSATPSDATGVRDGGVPTDATLLIDAAHFDAADADGATTCTDADIPLPNQGVVEAAGIGGCPAGMALVDTFCIDRYEAALIRATDAGESSWSPFFNPGSNPLRAVSAADTVPQAYISQTQASSACIQAGKRLCTNTEWLRACRGPSTYSYPYGTSRQPGTCNDARAVNPLVEYFGTSDAAIYSHVDHPCLNQLNDTVEPAGALAGCISAEGIYDLMGNLNEWTSDPNGTLRGGSYVDTSLNGDACLNAITAHDTSHYDYTTGFRCCADP
jgi:hypothetical protein